MLISSNSFFMVIFLRDFSNLQLFHKLNSTLHSFFGQILFLLFQVHVYYFN